MPHALLYSEMEWEPVSLETGGEEGGGERGEGEEEHKQGVGQGKETKEDRNMGPKKGEDMCKALRLSL